MRAILLIFWLLLVLVVIFGGAWAVRSPLGHSPRDTLVPTDEVYDDPSTGTVTRVWLDLVEGGRYYFPDR